MERITNIRRVLVTGAGGYIGSALVPRLLKEGYGVKAVDRFFFGSNVLPSHERLEVIVEDTRKLELSHFEGVDAVIDLAAISNDPSGELFQEATWQINCDARVRAAQLAKKSGVRRYVLPSSCSIYGYQEGGSVADEMSQTNPLTTYARANERAEQSVLPLADEVFCVVVLRQATVYGLSHRMRFDLAINGMTYGAWKSGKLPLMRDGTQWRPMVHVQDAVRAQMLMLEIEPQRVNGEIFNVGAADNVYQMEPLAKLVAKYVPRQVDIEWYGDPDHRSYRVAFHKIEGLGYRAERTAAEAVREICEALEAGTVDRTIQTITLDWYGELSRWHRIIREVEMYGGILEI